MINISPGKTRIGWIGTGVMGASMCGHLMRAGFAATVFNRTKAKAEKLLSFGAAWAESPRAVAEASDVIFTIVGYPSDVRSVILGEDGVLSGCGSGKDHCRHDHQPALAGRGDRPGGRQNRRACRRCPGIRRRRGAREAKLSIMIGGEKEVVEALTPCWEAMGKTYVHQGPPGRANTPNS